MYRLLWLEGVGRLEVYIIFTNFKDAMHSYSSTSLYAFVHCND